MKGNGLGALVLHCMLCSILFFLILVDRRQKSVITLLFGAAMSVCSQCWFNALTILVLFDFNL